MTTTTTENDNNNGLPVIPLSPIAQSYIICSNALKLATEKLTEAKKAKPSVQVGVLRSLLETSKVETHRLNSLIRKMQSVEGATALYWDPDLLARQIAVIDCQLFNQVFLDKRALSQLDMKQTKLTHLIDFHHYLSHSFAHQLIYWVEIISMDNNNMDNPVVPPVNPTKDSLITHLIRVAYLLLHAYHDFSGFAAIMKALMFPEVRRLNKKLWKNVSSRTKDMFRDLAQIVSPTKDYYAYQLCLRTKLESLANWSNPSHYSREGMMIVVPWIQPHLLTIRSIVTAYTAGDNEGPTMAATMGDVIVLSAPGVYKLDVEIALLELCQHNSTHSDLGLEDILTANGIFQPSKKKSASNGNNKKRASILASSNHPQHLKAIHLEGLRTAVIPLGNLNDLAPGEQLIHHWLVSRVYLRKDQLINESMEVEPLKTGETIICDMNEFDELLSHSTFSKPIPQKISNDHDNDNDDGASSDNSSPGNAVLHSHQFGSTASSTHHKSPTLDEAKQSDELIERELVDMSHTAKKSEGFIKDQDYSSFISHKAFASLTPKKESSHKIDKDKDDTNGNNDNGNGGEVMRTLINEKNNKKPSTTNTPVEEVMNPTEQQEVLPLSTNDEVNFNKLNQKENEIKEVELKEISKEKDAEEKEIPKLVSKEEKIQQTSNASSSSVLSSSATTSSTNSSKLQKSKLSPSAPEFIPSNGQQSKKSESIITNITNEQWSGYPIHEEGMISSRHSEPSEEKWVGYPVSSNMDNAYENQAAKYSNSNENDNDDDDDDDEVWKGYPGPNSISIDSPRRASSQSETSEEWKGYHATKMEADWQRESALKVQEHEWQGYALETLDEDELDSSTMMDGEFEKSRKARGQHRNHNGQILDNFQRKK